VCLTQRTRRAQRFVVGSELARGRLRCGQNVLNHRGAEHISHPTACKRASHVRLLRLLRSFARHMARDPTPYHPTARKRASYVSVLPPLRSFARHPSVLISGFRGRVESETSDRARARFLQFGRQCEPSLLRETLSQLEDARAPCPTRDVRSKKGRELFGFGGELLSSIGDLIKVGRHHRIGQPSHRHAPVATGG
jgi:hypothetical protein